MNLLVFNCFGGNGLERVDLYVKHLRACLASGILHVCVKGTCSTNACKRVLTGKFGKAISYLWIDRLLPVNVGFNLAVKKCVEHYGPFDCCWYVASDVDATDCPQIFQLMRQRIDDSYASVVARPDNDDGYGWCDIRMKDGEDYVLPVGKGVNQHLQAFHPDLYRCFGRLMPDIFVGDTTESVYTFLYAAVGRRGVILHKPVVGHVGTMDGASSMHGRGMRLFDPKDMGKNRSLSPQDSAIKMKAICEEGRHFGFGYEECQRVLMHDPAKFDGDGRAMDDRLGPFLKRRLFLQPEEFNYDQVPCEWVP